MAVSKRILTIFQFRRSTTEEWELNKDVIPAAGEPCYDLTLGTLKIGDGKTTYENLKAINGATISDDSLSLVVEGLQDDVDILHALVGTTSVEDQIANAMIDVAKSSDLEEVKTNIDTLETKVTTSTDSVTEIQTIVEQNNTIVTELKNTVEQNNTIVTELQTVVDNKAEKETVTQLETRIEQKVDTETIELLEQDLITYVDQQIQKIEVPNIDDGEI